MPDNVPARADPLVSIIMPAYNHAQYVREALMSVAAQTYPNIELIVIDDGSKDETAQIIEETLAHIERDMHVIFKSQENAGICTTLNRALSLANGTFVQFLASDDAYLPEMTSRTVAALNATAGDVGAVYCDGYLMDENSRLCGLFSDKYRVPIGRNIHRELLIANWFPAMGILYRRSALTAVGGFDPDLKFEDWDLLLRFTNDHSIERIPDKLFCYRFHSENLTKDVSLMRETVANMAKKHSDLGEFLKLKADMRGVQFRSLIGLSRNIDLPLRSISRKVFTNKGIQENSFSSAILQLARQNLIEGAALLKSLKYRIFGYKLGSGCRIYGRLRLLGNRRNLEIGTGVIFEGDAEFILPRGKGQGRVVIGDGCVVAQGALFQCLASDLIVGSSSYVGRNVVLQSNGDLKIGDWTMIAANAGLYAGNHVTSDKAQPVWTQGNSFKGITIGQNCWIGHGGVVVDGADLGEDSIVGPNRVVRGVHAPNSRLISQIE